MKVAFAVFALFLAAVVVSGQNTKQNRDKKVEQELRKLVQSWDEAYVKGDTATLDRLLADEFEFVGGPKKVDYLASFKSRPAGSVESALSTDVEVRVYGNTAVLTGLDTIAGKNNGQAYFLKWLYTDVWVKRGGRWQCVKTHASPANR